MANSVQELKEIGLIKFAESSSAFKRKARIIGNSFDTIDTFL